MSIAILTQDGFTYVGSWQTIDSKPHKASWIKFQPGLYAFTVGDEVVYIGMAQVLHRRLRNYSRRAFRNLIKAPRVAHSSIATGVAIGIEVKVFAKIMAETDRTTLIEAETALIQRLHPVWNQTHILRDHS